MSLASGIFTVFLAVFIVVDPFGIVPVYISLTAGLGRRRKRAAIVKSVGVAFVVLCVFIFTGNAILRFLGIQPGSFFIARGAMFLSAFLLRALGKTGVSVIERIMGIVLTGLSVQFVYDGLVKLRVIAGA